MWRFFRLFVILILVVLSITIGFFGYTEAGLHCLYRFIKRSAPSLTINRIQGHLLSEWQLEDIHYLSGETILDIKQILGQFSPWQLLTTQESLQKLRLDNLTFRRGQIKFQLQSATITAKGTLKRMSIHARTNNPGIIDCQINAEHLLYGRNFILAGKWHDLQLTLSQNQVLKIAGKAEGQGNKNIYHIDFSTNAQGFFNDTAFNSALMLKMEPENLSIPKLEIVHGNNHAKLQGDINKATNLQWSINAPQLSQLLPEISGSLFSEGHLKETAQGVSLKSFISASHLAYQSFHIDNFKLDLHDQNQKDFLFKGNLGSYTFNGKSTLGEHQVILNNFSLITPQRVSWTLVAPATLAWGKEIKLHHFNLRKKPNAYLLLGGQYSTNTDWSLKAQSDNLDLAFAQAYLPDSVNLKGFLNFDVDIKSDNGKIEGPFNMQIYNSAFTPPWTKVPLSNLNVVIENLSNHSVNYSLKGQSGDGKFTLSGKTELIWDSWPSEVELVGEHLLICNNDSARIIASPHLKLKYDRQFDLKGNITIHRSSITPPDFSSSLSMPDDIVYVGMPEEKNYLSSLPRSININLKTDDMIYFLYHGLEADVTGSLNITSLPQQDIMGTGQLTVQKGTYTAYKQKLNIAKGQLTYAGNPISNPGLNLRATKTIKMIQQPGQSNPSNFSISQNLIVGLDIEGTLDQPRVFLFSDPAILSQADILSYLLFGFPSSQASNNQLSVLFGVASTLDSGSNRFSGITNIMSDMEKKLGLSQFGFESSSVFNQETNSYEKNKSFVVGKQLSDKLNIKYSIGMLAPINILTLEYILSKRWLIRTEASTLSNGIDLLYNYEH